MILTFANRSVGFVGSFQTPIEIIMLVVEYLGGRPTVMTGRYLSTDVLIIGRNTPSHVIDEIESALINRDAIIVYEGKIDDHMPDERCFSDFVDKVKQTLPWGSGY